MRWTNPPCERATIAIELQGNWVFFNVPLSPYLVHLLTVSVHVQWGLILKIGPKHHLSPTILPLKCHLLYTSLLWPSPSAVVFYCPSRPILDPSIAFQVTEKAKIRRRIKNVKYLWNNSKLPQLKWMELDLENVLKRHFDENTSVEIQLKLCGD